MLNIVRPRFPKLDQIGDAFGGALVSGNVTNNGPYVRAFEEALSEYLGVPTICFSSGQAALMTMLAAAGVEGGNVICPSFTFAATPHAVVWAGARPVFADIDPHTLTIDVDDVESRITDQTRAILGVDSYGICCDYDALDELGRRYRIPVLYDSAASFGSVYKDKLSGGFGNAQIFSFHATKPFSTMEGGCLSTRDPVLLEAAKRIRNFGQEDNGDCRYSGLNGKMMEICAIIGREQLKAWPTDLASRRNAAFSLYEAVLLPHPGLAAMDCMPVWLYAPIYIQNWNLSRDEVIAALARMGIMARKYYTACHKMTAYRAFDFELPVTEQIAREVIALPVYSDMTQTEIDTIASALVSIKNGEV